MRGIFNKEQTHRDCSWVAQRCVALRARRGAGSPVDLLACGWSNVTLDGGGAGTPRAVLASWHSSRQLQVSALLPIPPIAMMLRMRAWCTGARFGDPVGQHVQLGLPPDQPAGLQEP
jgi:hypothetical protein